MILPEIEALRKQGRLPFVEREAQAEKQRRTREERAKHPAPTQDMSKFVMGKASDFALSGTFCPKCRIPLLVGCTQCVRCRLVFRKPVALGTRRKSEEWLRTPESY